MKNRSSGFLAEDKIPHDSEIFDYIKELHTYLWRFVRAEIPSASGSLDEFVDEAVKKAEGKEMSELYNCHDCGAKPGEVHRDGCDVEQCSVCGGQRLQCDCDGHDKAFARWTGIWPGNAEADYLGVDLNEFAARYRRTFFIKPKRAEDL